MIRKHGAKARRHPIGLKARAPGHAAEKARGASLEVIAGRIALATEQVSEVLTNLPEPLDFPSPDNRSASTLRCLLISRRGRVLTGSQR